MNLWESVDGLLDAVHELRHVKKRENKTKIKVKVITEHMDIEMYDARLSEDKRFCWVDDLNRLIIQPFIFREGGRQVVYLPEKTHGKLDYLKIKNIAEAQSYKILMRWRHLRKWEKTKVDIVDNKKYLVKLKETKKLDEPYVEVVSTGSIDWSLFNNDLSPSFSADSYLIQSANALNFLRDMTNLKLLLTILSCLLLGFIFGFMTQTMLGILYGMLT